ncbi:acyltransferase [Acinetobacter bereziniae]|uniref:acyltransferase family protein n=1 Tax=Acinetobacter bereziniae TaxID=106648 RepID=UPI0030174CD7
MKRFESLDWLRGLCALAIMFYHFISWTVFHPESGSILGNFGIYGVSIFFVLSGLSMGIVYNNYIKDFHTSLVFFIRRLFRLLPLLWIAIALVSAVGFILHHELDIFKIFLNITLLFGFLAPNQYINIGAWSIGNECVYYAFTPILIMLYARSKILGNLAVLLSILVGLYFTFIGLNSNMILEKQWDTYINPFNNFYLYTCGLALYYNFHHVSATKIAPLLILCSLLILCFYPVSGDQINIVTGVNDIIFSIASIILVLGFYKLDVNLPSWFSKPLANFGEATYGIYLLHPVVFIFTNKIFNGNSVLIIISSSIVTIIAANLSYKFYEKKWIKIGKNLTTFKTVKS